MRWGLFREAATFRDCRLTDAWWEHEGVELLLERVHAAEMGDPRRTLTQVVRWADDQPFPLGTAVRRLYDPEEAAVRSVADLCARVGVSSRTLRRVWSTGPIRCRPKEAVDWQLLLRALVLVRGGGGSS